MIKLLIVDDESVTRKGLMKHLNWSELGVDFIEEAAGGLEGLEIAAGFHPDIVLSDIRMPGMDGIQFANRIRTQFPECRIIFISGYSDKEYLKAAIHLNAVSYVEKPIDLDELKDVVKKAIALCFEDEKKKLTEKSISTALSESVPFIRQNVASNLICGKNISEELYADLKIAGVDFNINDPFAVLIIKPAFRTEASNEERLHGGNALLNMLEEQLKDSKHICAVKDSGHIIVIFSYPINGMRKQILTIFESLKTQIKESGSECTNLYCAAGQTVMGINQIRKSYETAVLALQKLFFRGYGQIVFYENKPEKSFSCNERILSTFSELLLEQNKNAIAELIEKLCRDIKLNEGTLADEVKNIFYKLSSILFGEAEKRGLDLNHEEDQGGKHLWSLISDFQTLQELKEYLCNITNAVIDGIEDMKSTSRAVLNVIQFIRENYSNADLSVKMLADRVYLTPTYLSTLFRKETGKTISDFIIEVRIERSKDLLVKQNIKLIEVAESVGYGDANYYAKVFKKQTGMAPSTYREKYII